MTANSMKEKYQSKLLSPVEALSNIRNGHTIFIGSGSAEPTLLTETLEQIAGKFNDVQVIQLLSQVKQRLASVDLIKNFRYNTFWVGHGVQPAISEGLADYTPINICEIPDIISKGIVTIDAALIQVSKPDARGMFSLGISVDIVKSVVNNSRIIIAQVNENMPYTYGDTFISIDQIDFLVEHNVPLIEVASPEMDPVYLTIGRHIANRINDGSTLYFEMGVVSSAAMRYLDTKKDLGIHTDIINDDILRLLKTGAVTNMGKKLNKSKTVGTMILGSEKLYKEVNRNEKIELYPIEYINNPEIISRNDNMVSIVSIREIDLSGLATADPGDRTGLHSFHCGLNFIDGTHRSKDGLVIMALRSTTPDGRYSNIVAESRTPGEYYSRSSIDIIVTEYGSVSLYGRSIRDRAIALISIAHPRFRRQLLEEAKRLHYVDDIQTISPESGCIYPYQYEFYHTFPDGTEVFFRPVKPSDARGLQKMFYTLSEESIRMRYHGTIKSLSDDTAQQMANIDYSKDMAILGLVGPPKRKQIIAEARYTYNPNNNMGEFDIIVSEEYRGVGIGKFLGNYINKVAYCRGLSGLYGEVFQRNAAIMALLSKAWPTSQKCYDSGVCTFTVKFPAEDIKRPKDSIIIYSSRFNDFSYGTEHPFKPDRAKAVLNLINDEALLNEPWMRVEEPRPITREKLTESHDPAYIEALEEANSGKWNEKFLQFHLGGDDCPIFPGIFEYILLYTSATLTGVDFIINENANVIFNPLGGFHHASRHYAEGFCYVNDIIVAIDTFLARGLRVAYVDIDAHHGNGVQDAYYQDDRVLTISTHQSGKTIYPWSGFETEIGEGIGRGYNINIPMLPETDDEAFMYAIDRVVIEALKIFKPNVIILVIGADTHKNDPLTNLALTNNSMTETIEKIRNYSNHLLMLGGGGYDVASTARAWTRMWSAANRLSDLPDYLAVIGGSFIGANELQGAAIIDRAFIISGQVKNEILKEMERVINFHRENTLPLLVRD